ncbi:NAD-glutamate dehydrogenase domain-containing protein, partial [Amycolatopsis japonica]|uniref:NAD-glutamate dehydrogenase domain-containing protein n=1 Tax=Amycolatopsis japonica TaxID=208439 RepID=UPI0037A7F298
PVELLWNGGIGTYVKAENESHADAGDKANDALRVNGNQLRVKVVGEGTSFGLTWHGRIEFARAGGLVNADFHDTSAQVDFVDREVNTKMLLDQLVDEGQLDVSFKYSIFESLGPALRDMVLEAQDRRSAALAVDRAIGDVETVPELAFAADRAKSDLKDELIRTGFSDEGSLLRSLRQYFPEQVFVLFNVDIMKHYLASRIAATSLANDLVDLGGSGLVTRLVGETQATPVEVAMAFAAASGIFEGPDVMRRINVQAHRIPAQTEAVLAGELRRLLLSATRWMLSARPVPVPVEAEIGRYRPFVSKYAQKLTTWLQGNSAAGVTTLADDLATFGVPADLASWAGSANYLFHLLNIADALERLELGYGNHNADFVGRVYCSLLYRIRVDVLIDRLEAYQGIDGWDYLASAQAHTRLSQIMVDATCAALENDPRSHDPFDCVSKWEHSVRHNLVRANDLVSKVVVDPKVPLSAVVVAVQSLVAVV